MGRVTTIERNDIELGPWRKFVRPAGPRLSPFAPVLGGYDQLVRSPGRHRTAANFTVPVVIPFESPHRIQFPDGDTIDLMSFVTGISDRPGAIEAGSYVGIQVDLSPVGAYRFTGGAIGRLAGGAAALDDVPATSASE